MAEENFCSLLESFCVGKEDILKVLRGLDYRGQDGLIIYAINAWEKKHHEYVNLIPRYEAALLERKINIADKTLRKPVNALTKSELRLFPKLDLLEQSSLDEVIEYAKSVRDTELLYQIAFVKLLDEPYTAYHRIKTCVEIFEWDNNHPFGKSFAAKMDCLPPQTSIRTRSAGSSVYDLNY